MVEERFVTHPMETNQGIPHTLSGLAAYEIASLPRLALGLCQVCDIIPFYSCVVVAG